MDSIAMMTIINYNYSHMAIFVFIIIHWYASLFFQSVFHHRYAAHNLFTMSRFWEKVFYFGCFITQGSSYISAYTYGLMHRLHHAHTDKLEDPHSPHNDPNPFVMMWTTCNDDKNGNIGNLKDIYLCILPKADNG